MIGLLALTGGRWHAATGRAQTEPSRVCGRPALAIREAGDKLLVFDESGHNLVVWAPQAQDGRVAHRAFFKGLNSYVQIAVDPRQKERHVQIVFETAHCRFSGGFPPEGGGVDDAARADRLVALRRD